MGRLVKLAFLSLVAMVTAEPYDSHPSGGGYDSHAPTGRYGSYPSSGYGSQPPSYGSGGYASHRQPRYNPYNPYHVMTDVSSVEEPLDLVDKLWERVDDVQTQNKLAAEMVDALNARMSLIKKFVDELELVTFPAFYRADINQNNDINNLWGHLDDLMTKLDELQNAIVWLETQNGDNSNHIRYLENAWVSNKEHDVSQDGNVAKLHVAAKDFKSKLFTALGNEFELFADKVETTAGKLAGTKGREQSRMCEAGTVTLTAEVRAAEYIFQSDFDEVPSVQYSITGINFNLNARNDPQHLGHGPPPQEPNAFGLVILNYPSKRSVVFLGYDFSFVDSQGMSADIDFLACTIGPGTEESDAHDVTAAPATTYGE